MFRARKASGTTCLIYLPVPWIEAASNKGTRLVSLIMETPTPKSISICSKTLNDFSSDVKALWATPIRTLETVPEPIDFYREFVSLSKPVLIRDAFPKTSLDDIISAMGDEEVRLNVDVTPDGHGDCIRVLNGERVFVMPETREMSLIDLRDGLRQQQKRRRNDDTLHEKDEHGLRAFHNEEDDRDRQGYSQRLEDSLHSSVVEDDEVFYYSRQVRERHYLTAFFHCSLNSYHLALNTPS